MAEHYDQLFKSINRLIQLFWQVTLAQAKLIQCKDLALVNHGQLMERIIFRQQSECNSVLALCNYQIRSVSKLRFGTQVNMYLCSWSITIQIDYYCVLFTLILDITVERLEHLLSTISLKRKLFIMLSVGFNQYDNKPILILSYF